MFSFITSLMVGAVGSYLVFHLFIKRPWLKRIEDLEHELQSYSTAIQQMADIQMKSYQKLSGNFNEIEERLLDLAVPSEDTNLPLERRRRIAALGGNGVSVEEIAKKIRVTRAEAELVLSLQKCRASGKFQSSSSPKTNRRSQIQTKSIMSVNDGELIAHAQA